MTDRPRSTRPAPPPVVDNNPPAARRPAPPAPEQQQAPAPAPAPSTDVATPAVPPVAAPQGDLLASLLASKPEPVEQPDAPVSDGAAMLLNLAAMRQQRVDPMNDYTADGTRKLKFVQAAIAHYASLTGKSRQIIETEALLGINAIPPELLDAHYLHLYKTHRPQA